MTRSSPPQVAFSSGELDPLLHRRMDYQRFQTGLAKCRGFLPLPQGGFTRAPGTWYRGETLDNERAVLVPFMFAADDAVVLEFSANVMRVWRYGDLVYSGGEPYELVTPYGPASLPNLHWVQSADVIYMTDGLRPMQRLARYALDNWTISSAVFTRGPFRTQNLDKLLTLQASASNGSITLTASAAFFTADQIGSLIELRPTDQTSVALWTSNEPLTVGDRRRYGENIYELVAGTNAKENPPQHTEGVALVDNAPVTWRYISDSVGVVRITAVTSTTLATATVVKRVPDTCVTDATYRFSEGAWSEKYGWPLALEIYDQRLVAAATPSEPRTVWFSAVGDYHDFAPGVEADEAFAYTIAGTATINRILNLKSGRTGLHIFALGEESSTRSETRAQVIGPTTAVFETTGSHGASAAHPIAPDGDPIFITRDKARVVQLAYALQQDGTRATLLSRPAQHLGAEGFEQIVWQSLPEPTAWLRVTAGQLVAMVYDAAEEVLGWAFVPIADGQVESMAVSSDATGTKDVLTLVVRRTISGVVRRFIEEQSITWGVLTGETPIAEANHLFCAREFRPFVPRQTFEVPHFGDRLVYAWTNQGEFGPYTLDENDEIHLPIAVSQAIIGLFDASHVAETLDIQAAAPDGNAMGRGKRLGPTTGIGLHRTAQGHVQTVERDFAQPERLGDAQALVPRSVAALLTQAYSGVTDISTPTGHAKELALRFTPYSGAPMTVTAIIPTIKEAGR